MILTKKDIEKLLPHRDPFLFLDSCKIIEIGTKGIGYKKFLLNENSNNIAIVSHNNFLKELLFQNSFDETFNLDHCNPYKLYLP